MLDLTVYEEKIISTVLAQMRIDNDELKVKTDYAIIMSYLASHVNLKNVWDRIP